MKIKTINLLIAAFFLIISFKLAIAFQFQGHPGEEITGEITQADLSCSNVQQSDITDDADFCVDADTRCSVPGLCSQLCLGDACIGSFAEVNSSGSNQDQMCNATGTCNKLCIGSTCITSFSGLGGGSDIVGSCIQGFIKEIDADGNIICQKAISADIQIGTISSSNILDGTITSADLSPDLTSAIGADYCAGGNCGKLNVESHTSDHPLLVENSAEHSVIDISSPSGKHSSIDFYETSNRKWGIGKNPSNNFYIDDSGGTVLTILSGGNVGIGKTPTEKLDVDGNIVATGTVCDGSGACVGDSFWMPSGAADVYYTIGNVGIGTSSPVYKLEISGGITKTAGGLIIETRTDDPSSLETGQIWLRTNI